jgi:hypothetical protein
MSKSVSALVFVCLLLGNSPKAAAEPITYFTSSLTNFYSDSLGLNSIEQDFRVDGSASAVSNSISVSEGTASASSSANLSTGQLKGFSTADGNPSPAFSTLYADSRSDYGDSFRAFSGDAPFTWAGATATFTLDVTGLVSLVGGAENGTGLGLLIFEAGTLDSYARWISGEDTYNEWSPRVIDRVDYVLGPGTVFPGTTQVSTFPATLSATFTPGADFDWAMYLITDIYMSNNLGAKSGTADFANTIGVSYTGPDGAVTRSASGLFPGTVPFDPPAPVGVPEPGTLVLAAFGFVAVLGRNRRKTTAH